MVTEVPTTLRLNIMHYVKLILISLLSTQIVARLSTPAQRQSLAPVEKRRRLLTEIMVEMVGKDEEKRRMLINPFHPAINATSGQCYNHVIGSFIKECVASKTVGGLMRIQAFFAVSCKAFDIKQEKISESINRVCKKFPFLKI